MDQSTPLQDRKRRIRGAALSGPVRKILTGAALFLAVCVIAVAGYMAYGWRLDDAVYMVIITIFGVGYGEVQPIDSIGQRTLTIVVIIAGYGAVIYTVGGFMQMLIDGELNRALGARKMNREIEQLSGHAIICGFGRMGAILARDLRGAGKPFVVVEQDAGRQEQAAEAGCLVVVGDASEEHVLQRAGIEHAAVLATVLSQDATNVFVTVTARGMNPRLTIIARGENPRTEKKLIGCGADRVVLPTAIGAHKLAQMIVRPSAENVLEQLTGHGDINEELGRVGLRFDELAIAGDAAIVGKTLADIELRSNHGFLIVGIRAGGRETLLNPPGDTKLQAGDVVIVLGHGAELPELAARLTSARDKITYRGVTLEVD